jgi:hypothetical protein
MQAHDNADVTARLLALRDTGMLDDAELHRELERAQAPDRTSPRKKRRSVAAILAVALIVASGFDFYMLANRDGGGVTKGASTLNAAGQSPVKSDGAPIGRYVETPARDAEAVQSYVPPTDYLQLCIYGGLDPLGARVSTFATFLEEQGQAVTWEPDGADWILRSTWQDRLTRTVHEDAYAFKRNEGIEPAEACDGPLGEVIISRMIRDGVPLRSLDPMFASILNKDAGQAAPDTELAPEERANITAE